MQLSVLEFDDSDKEEVDEMNIIDNGSDVDSDIDVDGYSVTTELMSKIHDFSGGKFCHTQLNAST